MLEVDGAVALVLLGLWIYCIFDVISTDDAMVRNLPKLFWLFIVFFIPDIGSIAWLILGRPQGTSFEPGSSKYRSAQGGRPSRPDDDPEFLARLRTGSPAPEDAEAAAAEKRRLAEWNEDLKRREAEMRRKEQYEEWQRQRQSGEGGAAPSPENP
ncbi:MAG: hypothetical protein QOG03_702 [Actinomycetota bacterium]|jgi:hypothetical protein|nr:hypothetical protein [Actinomycetota bacterium]